MKKYKILTITAGIALIGLLGNVQVLAVDNNTGEALNYKIQKIQLRENEQSDDDEITFELRNKAEKIFKNDLQKSSIKTTEINYGNGLIIKDTNLQWNGELDLSNKPKQIVLHHIEASRPNSNIPVEDVHSWHLANGWSGIGYHFYINKKGEIFRGRPEAAIGAHAKAFNINSLGISVEGKYGSETMNSIQKEAVIKLSKYLRQKYDIEDIKGHGELMPTDCPGKKYPLNEIRNKIKEESIVAGDLLAWKKIDNKWYYMNTWTGEKLTGWQYVNEKWYYMDYNGVMQTDWKLIDGDWYYMLSNGEMQKNWQLINGDWYYFNSSGRMQTGWLELGGSKYYLENSGRMVKQWQYINNIWYYFESNGKMKKDWLLLDNQWYYLNENGEMQKNWQLINGDWYYFNSSGRMQKNWQFINNEWYYMNSSGRMQKGWIKLDDKIYYLQSNGKMNKEGWNKINNNWHYMSNSGAILMNTTIQGIVIDENGIAKI